MTAPDMTAPDMPRTDTPPHQAAPPAPSFRQALRFWLWLGCVSFGGPAGQIALMHRELVERKRWIGEARFAHALNYCMLLPGPEAQQLATYIGWLLHKTWGGIAAGALFVLPSLALLIGLSWGYMHWGHSAWLAALLWGIKPVVVALVVHALLRLARRTWSNSSHAPIYIAFSAISFVAIKFFSTPFPVLLLGAACVGFWLTRRRTLGDGRCAVASSGVASGHPHAQADLGREPPACLADGPAALPHTVFTWRGLARVLLVGLVLWAFPLVALTAWQGWHGTLAQLAWFFTKAALVTFGGAYAVLPYVNQAAVSEFGWLTAVQMMDGLALGESTPGPLIMVLAFVGFVGGWTHPMLGPGSMLTSAVLAACVVTWFTFLPSFVFILGGGPLVESTRQRADLAEPLAAMGFAVLGAVASLGVAFLVNVGWPRGLSGWQGLWADADWAALGVALVALYLLDRRQLAVPSVIALGATVGLGQYLVW